jgi:hypothetical protein
VDKLNAFSDRLLSIGRRTAKRKNKATRAKQRVVDEAAKPMRLCRNVLPPLRTRLGQTNRPDNENIRCIKSTY